MDVIFAGTPAFAEAALRALLASKHRVRAVLTQPDRPVGRGLKQQASPVKALAAQHALEILQPQSLRLTGRYPEDAARAQRRIGELRADVMVVAAYGLLLPPEVLTLPRLGCINIHASVLPRWRGAAPIHRAIEAGDRETGITLMQMDAGLDTGAVLRIERVPILSTDTGGTLTERLALLGAALTVGMLDTLDAQAVAPTPQPTLGVSYAAKVSKAEGELRFTEDAVVLERKVRAFDPAPGTYLNYLGAVIKVWKAALAAGDDSVPGTVLAVGPDGIVVNCKNGAIRLLELQRAGAKRLAVGPFLNGIPLKVGDRFE